MPKEVLLYGLIYSRSSIDFINSINDIDANDSLTVRINSEGGEVLYGWGMMAKFKEFDGPKTVKVDGAAYSMGFNFCLAADNVEALDVSRFLLHRAAYPSWYESEYMTDEQKDELKEINKSLEAQLRSKVDVDKLEEISGKTVKEIFSMDDRIDVRLTAKQAKQIGLVNKIVKLTPKKANAINADIQKIAAKYSGSGELKPLKPETKIENVQIEKPKNNSKMTIEEFKKEHPEAYAAILKKGVEKERDRVGAWSTYIEVDPQAVAEGIKSGEDLSHTAMADFSMKMAKKAITGKVEGNAAPEIETEAPVQTETQKEAKEAADIQAKLEADLGLTKKKED